MIAPLQPWRTLQRTLRSIELLELSVMSETLGLSNPLHMIDNPLFITCSAKHACEGICSECHAHRPDKSCKILVLILPASSLLGWWGFLDEF